MSQRWRKGGKRIRNGEGQRVRADECCEGCEGDDDTPEENPNDGSAEVTGCRSLFYDHYTPHAAILEVVGVDYNASLCAECDELNGVLPMRLQAVSNNNSLIGTDVYYWSRYTNCDSWFNTSRIGAVPYHCVADCEKVLSPCYSIECGTPERLGVPMCKDGEIRIAWSYVNRTNPASPGFFTLVAQTWLAWDTGTVGVTVSDVVVDLDGLCVWDPATGRWYLDGNQFEHTGVGHMTGTPHLTCLNAGIMLTVYL